MQLLDPKVLATAEALFKRGETLARQGKRREAYQCFYQAVEVYPQHEAAWIWRAGVCETPAEMVQCLQQALAINPSNKQARDGLTWAQLRLQESPVQPAEPSRPAPTPVQERQLEPWETPDEPSIEPNGTTWLPDKQSNGWKSFDAPQSPVFSFAEPQPPVPLPIPIYSEHAIQPEFDLSTQPMPQTEHSTLISGGPAATLFQKPVFADQPVPGTDAPKPDPIVAPPALDIAQTLRLAKQALSDNKFGSAEQLLRNIIAVEPNSAEAYAQLGVLHYHTGRLGDAISDFQRSIEINSQYADAHFSLGVVYEEMGRLRDGLREYVITQHVDSRYPEVRDAILGVRRKINDQEAHGPQPTITCPYCKKRFTGRSDTCPHCKHTLYSICPNCEEAVDRAFIACPTCGERIPHDGIMQSNTVVQFQAQELAPVPEKPKRKIFGFFGKK